MKNKIIQRTVSSLMLKTISPPADGRGLRSGFSGTLKKLFLTFKLSTSCLLTTPSTTLKLCRAGFYPPLLREAVAFYFLLRFPRLKDLWNTTRERFKVEELPFIDLAASAFSAVLRASRHSPALLRGSYSISRVLPEAPKSPLSRGVGFASVLFGSKGRGVFLVVLILVALFSGSSFAQQSDVIPLAPFEGGLKAPFSKFSTETDSTQLDVYLQQAAQNNPALKAEFYEYRSILEQAPQVGTLPDPEVMFMYHTNPRNYSNPLSRMTVSATQMFPWFGSLGTAEKRVRDMAKARLTTFTNARNALFRDIKEVWFRMYETRHHLMIFRENLELLQTLESRALTLYETGKIGQVDVIRLQMEMDKVNTRIRRMEEKMEPLYIEFNTLLNRAPQAEVVLPMPMEHHTLMLSPDQLLQKVKARSPKLTELDYREQAARHSLEEARLDGLPSFGIGVEAMFPNYMDMPSMPGERTALIAKLSIRVPLYRSRYKAQRQEARLTIRSIEEQKNQAENSLIAEARKRLQEYRDAQHRITLYEENLVPKTEQALKISIESYSTEAANFEELIDLQRQLLEYEMGLNTAYVERNIAVAGIEYLYGKYNVELSEINN